jgi:hypothetical protein
LLRVWVIGLVVAAASPVRADPAIDGAKARLAEQVRALNARDAKAFTAMFRESAAVILPAASLQGHGRAAIAGVAATWIGSLGKATITVEKPEYGAGSMGAWYFANLVVKRPDGKSTTLRATGIVGAGKDPKAAKAAEYRVLALHISEAVADKVAAGLANAGKLPRLPAFKADNPDDSDPPEEYHPHRLAGRAWNAKLGVVVGSAPNEVAHGAAATALLAQWKKLAMWTGEVTGLRDSEPNAIFSTDIIVAHIEVTLRVGGKPTRVPFRVLAAWNPGLAGSDKPQLMVVHFSVATY